MSDMKKSLEMDRRRLLTLTAAGVSMATLGRFGVGTARAADTIRGRGCPYSPVLSSRAPVQATTSCGTFAVRSVT